jgi:hypothetical protein
MRRKQHGRTEVHVPGAYDGTAIVELLEDGRYVRLASDFGYVDSQSVRWDVPKGAVVDGASIPRALWSLTGGPFEGQYRAASIIHDWYCDLRSRSWRSVHRMFHEAMLAAGVTHFQASLMYAGVYWGGPRWSSVIVENTRLLLNRYLEPSSGSHLAGRRFHATEEYGPQSASEPPASVQVGSYKYDFKSDDLLALIGALSVRALALDEIEDLVDRHTERRERMGL